MEPALCYTGPSVVEKLELANFSAQHSTATFTWAQPRNLVAYFSIKYWQDVENVVLATSQVPVYTLRNLQPGTCYYVQVAAVAFLNSKEIFSPYSAWLPIQTGPKAPYELEVFPGLKYPTTSLRIRFKDDDTAQKRYIITVQSLIDESVKTMETDCLVATIEGLDAGCSYDVGVIGVKNGVESKKCRFEKWVQTYPDGVEDLEIERSSASSQSISWSPVFSASSYIVKYRRCDENYQTKETGDTELTLQDLDSGHVYKVCVAAVNSAGTGSFTEAKSFTTDLAPPSGIQATVQYSNDGITMDVDFTCPSQHLITNYLVELLSEDGETLESKSVKAACASFNQLRHSTCYTPSVCSVTENGLKSNISRGDAVWTKPSQLKISRCEPLSGNCEKLIWEPVKGAVLYIVKYKEEGQQKEFQHETNATEFTLVNLALNTKFSVSIAAKNQGGIGYFSHPISFQTALSSPIAIAVSNIPGYLDSGILVSWDPCPGAVEYYVDIVNTQTNDVEKPRKVERGCSYKFFDLRPGCEYKAMIQAIAVDPKHNSASKSSSRISTYCCQVKEVTFEHTCPTTFDIAWEEVRGADEYRVIWKASDGTCEQRLTQTNHETLPNLKLGETYSVTVTPRNSAGYSKESNPVTLKTGMSPPRNIVVTNSSENPSHAVKISFDEPQKRPIEYGLSVVSITDEKWNPQSVPIDKNYYSFNELKPGTEYIAYVCSVDPDNPQRNSEKIRSLPFWTAPEKVVGVHVTKNTPVSYCVTWQISPGAKCYVVRLKKDGCQPILQTVDSNEIHFDNLSRHSVYKLTVRGKNEGGMGEMSSEVLFETGLFAPRDVQVSNSSRTSTTDLNITLKEPEVSANKYRIRLISLSGRDDILLDINRQQAMSIITIPDLKPGEGYQVAVCSIHENDERLNSEEILSGTIETRLPALTAKLRKLGNDKYKVTWNAKIDAQYYKIFWRIEHDNWQEREVPANEAILSGLDAGCNFEVKVTAYSDAGPGQESPVVFFTTAPPTPTGLKVKMLSTLAFVVTCDKTVGASSYIFNIAGQCHEENEPKFELHHDAVNTNFIIQVSAKNKAGSSKPSTRLKLRQSLLHLQTKFLKLAATKFVKEGFIAPVLEEVPSNDKDKEFGTSNFYIANGQTVVITGEPFSGKTACCSHYLQSLSERKLGMFLDWDDFKNISTSMDMKAVLRQYMVDANNDELSIILEWMKDHSEQVVFVIDNFTLPTDFTGSKMLYDETASPEILFYNFVDVNREIFPKSQVLCTTSQAHLRQIVDSTRTLKIVGFDAQQMEQMKERICGKNSEKEIPRHLEYFCKNPSYCEIILQILKDNDPNTDLESYSSVLVTLLVKSINRSVEAKQKEKLGRILQDIKGVSQTLRTVKVNPEKVQKKIKSLSDSASTIQYDSDIASFVDATMPNRNTKHSCAALHDYTVKALYFAFICSVEEFKGRFRTKKKILGSTSRIVLGVNAKIWILAAGLLREETRKLALELFRKVNEDFSETVLEEKLRFTGEFVSKNLPKIQEQLFTQSQVLLDWCNIINEINVKGLLKKFFLKIELKNSMEENQIDQVSHFLRYVRGNPCDGVKLKISKELDPSLQLSIDRAIRDNPCGERILMKDATSSSSFFQKAETPYQSFNKRTSVHIGTEEPKSLAGGSQNDDVFSESGTTPERDLHASGNRRSLDGSVASENAQHISTDTEEKQPLSDSSADSGTINPLLDQKAQADEHKDSDDHSFSSDSTLTNRS